MINNYLWTKVTDIIKNNKLRWDYVGHIIRTTDTRRIHEKEEAKEGDQSHVGTMTIKEWQD